MPNQPVSVPMWMAMALSRRKKCRLLPPDWLSEDHLKGARVRTPRRLASTPQKCGGALLRAHASARVGPHAARPPASSRAEVLSQERSNPQMFQPLPFYYVEIANALFTYKPVETFGSNQRFSKASKY